MKFKITKNFPTGDAFSLTLLDGDTDICTAFMVASDEKAKISNMKYNAERVDAILREHTSIFLGIFQYFQLFRIAVKRSGDSGLLDFIEFDVNATNDRAVVETIIETVNKFIPDLTINKPKVEEVKVESEKATSYQVGGSHYQKYKIQPIDFITQNELPFCEANVIKYVLRHADKNGKQDLEKAKHYIDLIIQNKY